jgi:flagellar biosynthesis protein FlhG
MPDQATILRGLMERHALAASRPVVPGLRAGPRSLVITSGKGGVGKSHIALNVAVDLAKSGRSVCLLDTNPAPGNLELLCGLDAYWNLKHVLSGARSVADVAVTGPHELQLLSGAAELLDAPLRSPTAAQSHAWAEVSEYLQQFQYVIIDTASGDQPLNRRLISAADCTWLVTTSELTAIADAYSLVKSCAAAGPLPQIEILVNRPDSASQARDIIERMQQTARSFLHQELYQAGYIPHDLCVPQAVNRRQPFVLSAPQSAASQAITQLARQWRDQPARNEATFTQRVTQPAKRAA